MRILLVHNRYRNSGGEDSVFQSECDLLRRMNNDVDTLVFDNHEIESIAGWRVAVDAVWSLSSRATLARRTVSFSPHVIHFHNTFLRVSPAPYWVASAAGIPVVQTLHNYRLLCVNAQFLRNGKPCEDCLGKTIPWPGLLHRCYHNSLRDSGLVSTINVSHRVLGTYATKVDAFIALTQFSKNKFIEGGLPASKIHVKPNFVEDQGVGRHDGGYCLFVGRLSQEKGITTLLVAWARLPAGIPLKVAGAGPMESLLREPRRGVEYVGSRSRHEIHALMRDATVAIVPSAWYEGFPVVIAEAFAAGLPVIASRLGSMEEILHGDQSGWLFAPGDADDLARTVRQAWEQQEVREQKGKTARLDFERKFSPEVNYRILERIYEDACKTVAVRHA
jgi:glycosyltransferase involved in cell wall biosynthesis